MGQAARGRLRTGRYWTVLAGLKAASLVVGSTPRGLPVLCFGEQDASSQVSVTEAVRVEDLDGDVDLLVSANVRLVHHLHRWVAAFASRHICYAHFLWTRHQRTMLTFRDYMREPFHFWSILDKNKEATT